MRSNQRQTWSAVASTVLVVDTVEQRAFRQRLELGWHHRSAEQHGTAVLPDHRSEPQPGRAEQPVVAGGVAQGRQPQHVLLQDHDPVGQAWHQHPGDGGLAGAAGAGEAEQRQPHERLPAAALGADQRAVVDPGDVRSRSAVGTDQRVHPDLAEEVSQETAAPVTLMAIRAGRVRVVAAVPTGVRRGVRVGPVPSMRHSGGGWRSVRRRGAVVPMLGLQDLLQLTSIEEDALAVLALFQVHSLPVHVRSIAWHLGHLTQSAYGCPVGFAAGATGRSSRPEAATRAGDAHFQPCFGVWKRRGSAIPAEP